MKNLLFQEFGKYIKLKILSQLLCYIVPALIGVILSSSAVKQWILSHVSEWCRTLLVQGWVQFVLVIIGTLIIPCFIYIFIEYNKFQKHKSGYDILLWLITYIDDVVKQKRLRFQKIRENHYKSDQTIFRNITKPEFQLSCLCEALCLIMRYLTNDEEVKSAVFYCANNRLQDILAVCGEDKIKPKISELNKRSLAKYALEKRCSQIVSDTRNDDSFIKPYGCKAKSAFVMPIYNGSDAVFVICFTSPNIDTFNQKGLKKCEFVVEEISSRMILEWHLYELLKQGSYAKKKK